MAIILFFLLLYQQIDICSIEAYQLKGVSQYTELCETKGPADCCPGWSYYLWLVWCGFAWPVAAFFSYFQYKRRTRMVRKKLIVCC